MVVIRMSRGGRVHCPSYTIVAVDSRRSRDGAVLERLGKYEPSRPNGKTLLNVKKESIANWLSKGAKLSHTVRTQLSNNGIQL